MDGGRDGSTYCVQAIVRVCSGSPQAAPSFSTVHPQRGKTSLFDLFERFCEPRHGARCPRALTPPSARKAPVAGRNCCLHRGGWRERLRDGESNCLHLGRRGSTGKVAQPHLYPEPEGAGHRRPSQAPGHRAPVTGAPVTGVCCRACGPGPLGACPPASQGLGGAPGGSRPGL